MFSRLDPLAHVRDHPRLYLPEGRVDPLYITTRLASDAVLLGASRTYTTHRGDDWMVDADIDWLAEVTGGAAEAFRRVLPLPVAGRNAFRGEVLVGAFAEAAATWTPLQHTPVTGNPELLSHLEPDLPPGIWKRAVLFRMSPAGIACESTERAGRVYVSYSAQAPDPLFSIGPSPFSLATSTPNLTAAGPMARSSPTA